MKQTLERIWVDPHKSGPNWHKKPVWEADEYVRADVVLDEKIHAFHEGYEQAREEIIRAIGSKSFPITGTPYQLGSRPILDVIDVCRTIDQQVTYTGEK